jgi:LysM repeat protein
MTAGRSEHRSLRIRRRGRHTTPSQVEKVAEKAGKAAPAVAIAGALVAAPQAQHAFSASAKPAAVTAADTAKPAAHQQRPATATLDSVATHSVLVSSASKARHAARVAAARNTYYKVRTGDTLSKIAERYYHNAGDWQWLYHENDKTISDPNLIYTGETLYVPAHAPANYKPTAYVPRHAKPSGNGSGSHTVVQTASQSGSSTSHSHKRSHSSKHSWTGSGGSGSASTLSGTLGCSGLEQLWEEAGGNPSEAFMAAEIAMAESGGYQYAHSPTDDYGYWQINAVNGSLATYDAYGNARAAVIISHDGTDWYPWTTYTSGAYHGRC